MRPTTPLLCAAVLAALALGASNAAVGASDNAVNRARGLIDSHPGWVNRAANDAFTVKDVVVDGDGTEHVRFDRSYAGLPVIGGDVVVHSRNNALKSTSMTLATRLRPSTAHLVSADDAIVEAGVAFGQAFHGLPTARKVIYAREAQPVLAWEVTMKGTKADQTPTEMHYFVDARSGRVLDGWDLVHTAATPGTGHTQTLGTVALTTDSTAAGYQLLDPSRGNGATYDALNVAYTGAATGASLFTGDSNVWGDGTASNRASAAAEAHYGVATTWDFYQSMFGRLGIFGNGYGVKSYVHVGSGWANAAWYNNAMYYGDGDATLAAMTSLDIAGHEMSHGVMQSTAGLVYSNESGGLNEANSDIMGSMVEFYANNPNDAGDYLIGERVFRDNPTGTRALRAMFKQDLDGKSYVCFPKKGLRGVDPHYSSGIANRFFYLLAEGATVPDGFNLTPSQLVCNGNTAITGIGRDKATRIWYRSLYIYTTSTATYANARTATLQSAADLYGAGSAEYNAVNAAWAAVSVR